MQVVFQKTVRSAHLENCGLGLGESCYELGLMWGNGNGGRKDLEVARKWVDEACKQGHGDACDFLPLMAE